MTINLGKEVLYFNAVNRIKDAEEILPYHKCLLFSAYHFWKKSLSEIRDKAQIFVDSGGFQVKSLTDKQYFPLKEVSYWQLLNANVTAIRDSGLNTLDKDINFKLQESLENAKFILNMRKEIGSETKILGVIHGSNKEEREKWTDEFLKIKELDGFAFGGVFLLESQSSKWTDTGYEKFMKDLFYILQKEKELKWAHFFAMTAVELVGVLPYLMDRINKETDYKIGKISFDNSSPQTGGYLYNYQTPYESWRMPQKVEVEKGNFVSDFDSNLPCFCKICIGRTFKDLYETGAKDIGVHNLIQYVQKINYIYFLYNNNKSKWEQFIGREQEAIRMKNMIDGFIDTGKVITDVRSFL